MNLKNAPISTRGAGQFLEPYATNDMSWLVLTTNIHYPSNHARGVAQIPQSNSINVRSQLLPAISIHIPSSHARGAAQFPPAHAINDNSWLLMEGTTMILDNSSSPPKAPANFWIHMQLMTCLGLFHPQTSTILRITPEVLPKFHSLMQLMLDLG